MTGWTRFRRVAFPLAVLLAVVICLQGVTLACPTCKDGVAADPHRADLVRGYFWSIVFMMSMPFLILAGLASYFYFEVRRARARQPQVARTGRVISHGLPASGAALPQ